MNFGEVLELLKKGSKISRIGWNGKNMYIYLVDINIDYPFPPLQGEECWKADAFEYLPFIVMKTVNKKLTPWFASQTDILAEDWIIVDDEGNPLINNQIDEEEKCTCSVCSEMEK